MQTDLYADILAAGAAGRIAEVGEAGRARLAAMPADEDGHLMQALWLAQTGRADDALRVLIEVAAATPLAAGAQANLGKLHLWLDRPAEAARHFRRALQARPYDINARYYAARLAAAAGDFGSAALGFRQVLLVDPAHAGAAEGLHPLGQACGDIAREGEENLPEAAEVAAAPWRWPAERSHVPITQPGRLTVLTPTRGRPETLRAMIDSIAATAARPRDIIVQLRFDDDDHAAIAAARALPTNENGPDVRIVVGPRLIGLTGYCNELWRSGETGADLYFGMADDMVFATAGWDVAARQTLARHVDGVGIVNFQNPSEAREQFTFGPFSAAWVNEMGQIGPDYFPFWFGDQWIDEIARMVQRRMDPPIWTLPNQGKGKTWRMWNLPFWYKFYLASEPERVDRADRLRFALYGDDPLAFEASRRFGRDCRRAFHARTLQESRNVERADRVVSAFSAESGPTAVTEAAEARARELLKTHFGPSTN